MNEVLQFQLSPERRAELEQELAELDARAEELLKLLGRRAVEEPLPTWVS